MEGTELRRKSPVSGRRPISTETEGAVRWAKAERGRCGELPGHWQAVKLAGMQRTWWDCWAREHAVCM